MKEESVFFVWRGWGPFAVVAAFLPIALCGGFMQSNPIVAIGSFGVTLFASGLACHHFGLKWNQGSGLHSMYWIPLEIWGWLYIVVGAFFAAIATIAILKQIVVG